jgi:hypothetical protein
VAGLVLRHLARARIFRRRAGGSAGFGAACCKNYKRGGENDEFSDGEIPEHGFLRMVSSNQQD